MKLVKSQEKLTRKSSRINNKVSGVLWGILLTFCISGCRKQAYVFVQPSLQEHFERRSKMPRQKSVEKITLKKNELSDSVKQSANSLILPIIPTDKLLIINPLEANLAKSKTDFQSTIRHKLSQNKPVIKPKPKPKFLGKFREKLKNWHPFRRKHRFTRKMTIGLVLLAIAVGLELLLHVQTLTLIFGLAALIYIIQGLKKLF